MKNTDSGSEFSSLMSIPEYARLLGLTNQAIYAQINSGRLDHAIRNVGKRRYVDMDLVDQREFPARRVLRETQTTDRPLFDDDIEEMVSQRHDNSGELQRDDKSQANETKQNKSKIDGFSSVYFERRIREEKLRYLSAKREGMELQVQRSRGELIPRNEVEGVASEYYAESRQLLELLPQKIVAQMGLDDSQSLLLETVARETARQILKRMEQALEKKKSEIMRIAGL